MSVIYKALRSIESEDGVDNLGFDSGSVKSHGGDSRSISPVVLLVSIAVLAISGVAAGFAWQWSSYNNASVDVPKHSMEIGKKSLATEAAFASKIILANNTQRLDTVNLKSGFAQKDGVSIEPVSLQSSVTKIEKQISASSEQDVVENDSGGVKTELTFQPKQLSDDKNAVRSSVLLSKVLAEFEQPVEAKVSAVSAVATPSEFPSITPIRSQPIMTPETSGSIRVSINGQPAIGSLQDSNVGVIAVASNGTVNSLVEPGIIPVSRHKKDPIFYTAEIQMARQRPTVRTTGIQDTQRIRILRINLDRALQNRDQQEIRAVLMHLQSMVGIDSSYMLKIRAYVQVALGGDMEYAIDLLRQVLVRNPRDKDATMNMAVAESNLGRTDSARIRLGRLAAQYPDDEQLITLINSIP